ncbi:hypothetical protein L1D31_01465 [Vibrio sp. Isolate23]|uniref:hypothetical protein n=1 Tax=Vibrio sp. Isolate23 TaxID=2908533 RepID=UPI001EFC5540|nr:hypothetical protein [Vibrio sp. Isolate23]MCG9681219.1 hypothetical protein [Vibrio sp. Isolate23]
MKKIISIMGLVLLSGCASKYQPSPTVERVWVKQTDETVATPEELKAAKDKCDYHDRLSEVVSSFKYTLEDMNEDLKRYAKVKIEVSSCMFDLGYYKKKITNNEKS